MSKHPSGSPPLSSTSGTGLARHAAPGLLLAAILLLGWVAVRPGLQPDVDSGPYVSMARHLAESARPVSSFQFLGSFAEIPAPPNFAPPGFPLLLAVAGGLDEGVSPEAPAKGPRALFLVLLAAAALAAYDFLRRATGDRPFAAGAAALLVAAPPVLQWAGMLLTELPFLTALLTALAAGLAVLQRAVVQKSGEPVSEGGSGTSSLPAWAALTVASAALPLVRYLGVFFPPAFGAVYLWHLYRSRGGISRSTGGDGGSAPSLPAEAGKLLLYGFLSYLPPGLWLLAVRSAGAPLTPERPESLLSLGAALGDAGSYVVSQLGPWLVVALLLGFLLRRKAPAGKGAPEPKAARKGKGRKPAGSEPAPRREAGFREAGLREAAIVLALTAGLAYLLLLILLRTSSAYYPLTELGERYLAPVWPPLFLALAAALHRWARPAGGPLLLGRGSLGAWAAAVAAILLLAGDRLPPRGDALLFPAGTATYQAARDLIPPGDGVLANFGQVLTLAEPRRPVVGIPSRQDFQYQLDEQAVLDLARRHSLSWVVLFDVPGGDEMYGLWYDRWRARPPQEWPLQDAFRTADGVIFHLDLAAP